MQERELIEVELGDKKFKFYLKPNLLETQRIKQEEAKMLDGIDNHATLEANITENYYRHVEHNKKKYGEEYGKMLKRLDEIEKEAGALESEEYIKIFDLLHNNTYYYKYMQLTTEKAIISDYAYMQVCVVSPAGYNFYEQPETEVKEIAKLVREKKREARKALEKKSE